MTHWSLAPIFDSYTTVIAVTLALTLLLLVAPNYANVSRRRRVTLALLRFLVIIVLALAMLRPTVVRTTTRTERSTLLLLLDQSRSMQLPHTSGGVSRWEAQRSALQAATPALRAMADRIDVKTFAYDQALVPLAYQDGAITLPTAPVGTQTDIGSPLHAAVQQELGKRLAGVLVLGDGVQTAFEPQIELYEAGRELERLGYPLFTVAFGPAGSAAQSRDVAIESMPDQFTVFVKNEVLFRGLVRVHGYVNQQIPVDLLIEDAMGRQTVLGPQPILAREDGQQIEVTFPYTPTEVGQYRVTLRAAPQAGELVTRNNQLTSYLTVLEGGLRVLYLEGQLRNEQRFLMRALDASPDMALDFQWIDMRQRERWPVSLRDELEKPKFDVLILGDLDATALGERNMNWIAEAVRRGRGLIMLGGYHSFGPGGYFGTPLADVLPIQMDRLERQDFGKPPRNDLHLAGPIIARPAREHSVIRLAPGNDNAARWASLPPWDGANRLVGVKDAAGVQVLLETAQEAPLLVSGEFGQGRVLALAGDSTWRWAMRGAQAEHKRFWRQVVLWLSRRDESTQNDIWIKLGQRRFPPGAVISFTAGAKNPAGETLTGATLAAELVGPGGTKSSLRLARDGETWAGLTEAVRTPGDYRIEITATEAGRALGNARGEFHVFDQDIELATAAADHDQLARLAEMTQEFGGRAIAPEDLPALLQELHAQSEKWEVPIQARWQLTDTAMDAWTIFIVLLALLTGEWYLRKRWGLV